MFQKNIKQIAIRIAVLLFFIMSLIGWICGLPVGTCSTRAALGAVAGYHVVRIAGQFIVWLLVKAMIDEQIHKHHQSMQG